MPVSIIFPERIRVAICVLFLGVGLVSPAWSDFKEDVGWNVLKQTLGDAMPNGSGITVSQIEANAAVPDSDEEQEKEVRYYPDVDDPEFVAKTITLLSEHFAGTDVSGHATKVGRYLYGGTTSMASGISDVDVWEANHWNTTGFLNAGTMDAPEVETRRIENHSWIGEGSPLFVADTLRRIDYVINRDNTIVIAGLGNAHPEITPVLLSNFYNGITVGMTNGTHSEDRALKAAGRIKPDIVVPLNATSFCTPVVAASAAMLLETVDGDFSLSAAANPEVIKAILMAGATKEEFDSWTPAADTYLDATYGAGELNIYNSYFILAGGEQEASASGLVSNTGWDFNTATTSPLGRRYFFEVPLDEEMKNLSVILTWNRKFGDSHLDTQNALADMNLRLYRAVGFNPQGAPIVQSTASNHNVEHLYLSSLDAGRYVLEVTSDTADVEYGLAWMGLLPIPPLAVLGTQVDLNAHEFTLKFRDVTRNPAALFTLESRTNSQDNGNWNEEKAVRLMPMSDSGVREMVINLPSSDVPHFWRIKGWAL